MPNNKKEINERLILSILGMIAGTIIYSLSVIWFLEPGGFYAGGITGISQIIVNLLDRIGVDIPLSVFVFILNVPVVIIAFKGVSKKFAYLSIASIILQTITLYILERIDYNPFRELTAINIDGTYDSGKRLTLAIIGGLLYGVGCGIALRGGASTGGTDLLSQYMTFKKGIPFTYFTFSLDIIVIIGGSIIGNAETGLFTIVRLVISVLVIDKVHTIYNYMKVTIVTTEKEKMRVALISNSNHGVTIFEAFGGYSQKQKYVLESIVSSYESPKYRDIAQSIDPNSFIYFSGVKKIYGKFHKNVIQ